MLDTCCQVGGFPPVWNEWCVVWTECGMIVLVCWVLPLCVVRGLCLVQVVLLHLVCVMVVLVD